MKERIVYIGIIFLLVIASFNASATFVQEEECGCSSIVANNEGGISGDHKYGLGLLVDNPNDSGLPEPIDLIGNPPSSWDWRDVNGKNWVTPIRDQGPCGSCYAFAVVAAMESMYRIQKNDPNLDIDLSEQAIVSCSQSFPWINGGCCGGLLSETLLFLRVQGVPSENCFPYAAVDANGRDAYDCPDEMPSYDPVKCSDRCPNWEDQVRKISSYHSLYLKRSIKIAISSYGPVIASFKVYEDFYDYDGGIYEHEYGALEGNHLVAIIGYDDSQGYWICKNSWGTYWGEDGFFKIKYGECKIDSPRSCVYFKHCSKSQVYFNSPVNQLFEKVYLLQYFLKVL